MKPPSSQKQWDPSTFAFAKTSPSVCICSHISKIHCLVRWLHFRRNIFEMFLLNSAKVKKFHVQQSKLKSMLFYSAYLFTFDITSWADNSINHHFRDDWCTALIPFLQILWGVWSEENLSAYLGLTRSGCHLCLGHWPIFSPLWMPPCLYNKHKNRRILEGFGLKVQAVFAKTLWTHDQIQSQDLARVGCRAQSEQGKSKSCNRRVKIHKASI